MKKAIVIGAGLGGLTFGAFLAKDGWQVMVCDRNEQVGGVCALTEKNGFRWPVGPRLLSGLLPGEDVHDLLKELGITLETVRADRSVIWPDFALTKPESVRADWRKERLKELFPEEAAGIDAYYKFYADMLKFRHYGALQDKNPMGFNYLRMYFAFQKVKKYAPMSAKQLLDGFFKSPKLKAVFAAGGTDAGLLSEEAMAMSVAFNHFETSYDQRLPLDRQPGYVNIAGGVHKLPEALAQVITGRGGEIRLNTVVSKVLVENGRAVGVQLEDGTQEKADLVVGSGGAKDFFVKTVGIEHLGKRSKKILSSFKTMESVFMVHLGLDEDPMRHLSSPVTYVYGTYDMDGMVRRLREGKYHEGSDGYIISVPTAHAPQLAPEGRYCLTLCALAPDKPVGGDWMNDRERWADRLIDLAQKQLPDLRSHIVERHIETAVEYRRLCHTAKSSHAGLVPAMGLVNPQHRTAVKHLWFVGQQSESTGGVGAVMTGAKRAFVQMKKENKL